MTIARPARLLIAVLVVLTFGAANVGCILDQIPPEDAALIGLSWFKDLVIGDKIRLDFIPSDGCYRNGVKVDCSTMMP
ncbi:MAG TPA: hypothetical protein VLM89_16745 [Phycisphaerae bacterium]|nr:hypothetical protein [Phycisphaerae bacterium]